jgi:hypothetical protein
VAPELKARRRLIAALGAALAAAATALHAQSGDPLAELARPGRLLMLRHALAPGNGDPPGFRLGDCTTQRNLDEVGREQARRMGERLRRAGIARAKVYSSQWCRCLETARLLNVGPVEELPALNSFYNRAEAREARVAALRAFVARLPVNGPPVIFATHQFTIGEFTGGGTGSGGGMVFELDGSGSPRPIGAVPAD